MRNIKFWFVLGIFSVVLAACSSSRISKLTVPSGSDVAVTAYQKKADLTETQKQNWQHLDLVQDSIPGMSVDKAYEFLANKEGEVVVVAVVDSGTDLEHEDLSANAWINEDEKPNNGKDDDKNGFVDDVKGWNFLGKIHKESMELHRIMMDSTLVDADTFKKAKEEYNNAVTRAKGQVSQYQNILRAVNFSRSTLAKKFDKDKFTKKEVEALEPDTPELRQAVAIAKQMYGFGLASLEEAVDELTKLIDDNKSLASGEVLKANYRSVLNNDENSMDVVIYGDANSGPAEKSESHGTHVSGIIGAVRNNKAGMKGVANHVKIMAVRVVPDGDEYDKDVALGIRYAVDNGAKVINTSFGKGYSPKTQWVYDAIKYAADNDVLIVNAAGNDANDIDKEVSYPNDTPDGVTELADNFITIGAISSSYSENLPATFTNYGKQNVDVFAPGVQVYSTTPENEYAFKNGTSMAAPATAGVAALIRSYYPKLSASQVKRILMNSGSKLNLEVVKPGSKSREKPNGEKVPFSELSVSGRIVNAYNAVKMAEALYNQ